MRDDLTISGGWSRRVVAGMEALGVEVRSICRDLGLDYGLLTDPDARVPRDQSGALWREAARRSGDRDLGLHVGESIPPLANNLLSHLAMSCSTLLEGAERTAEYQELIAHGRVLSIERRGDVFALLLARVHGDLAVTRNEIEFMAVVLYRVAGYVSREGFRLEGVEFEHPFPGAMREHERIFACPVRFGAASNGLLISAEIMQRPLPHYSPQFAQQLEELVSREAGRIQPTTVEGRVRGVLRARLGRQSTDTEAVAAAVHMSPRTMQRRLKEEGTHFGAILDGARRDLCLELLGEGESPARIAQQTGFSDPRALRRAFKRWTGSTPSEYRDAAPSARP